MIMGVAVPLITLAGLIFGAKRSGRNEAYAEQRSETYKSALESWETRAEVDRGVNDVTGSDLNRLRSKWEYDDPESVDDGERKAG
jgi:hypothetical protein